jgi:hypothetical protein
MALVVGAAAHADGIGRCYKFGSDQNQRCQPLRSETQRNDCLRAAEQLRDACVKDCKLGPPPPHDGDVPRTDI